MKISKVNHTRWAVGNSGSPNQKELQGFFYQDPNKKNENNDFEHRFNKLNQTAQRLYNVFNVPKDSKDKGLERLSKEVNRELKIILFKKDPNKPNHYKVETDPVQVKFRITQKSQWDKHEIDELMNRYLRRGLSGAKNELAEILYAICSGDKSKLLQEDTRKLLSILDEDYEKKEFKKKLKTSLQNQNMLVQPQQEEKAEKAVITVTKGHFGEIKNKEKEALDEVLSSYANLDEAKRMIILRKLRRLTDLYFSAPDDVKQAMDQELIEVPAQVDRGGFDVWKKHEEGKAEKREFVQFPDFQKTTELDKNSKNGKRDQKELLDSLKQQIRRKNIDAYRYSIAVTTKYLKSATDRQNDDEFLFFEKQSCNAFWIHHIESAVERILRAIRPDEEYKVKIAYLREKVWKDIINYLSIKYIAIGKAVFNFAMDDLDVTNRNIEPGKLPQSILNGINSFNYEQIKADETLQRQTAVMVATGVNHFSRAVVKIPEKGDQEDILLWQKEKVKECKKYSEKDRTLHEILQFFGGASSWENIDLFKNAYANNSDSDYEVDLICDIKDALYSLRNETFHYRTFNKGTCTWNQTLFGMMFENDAHSSVSVERTKFYSNNLSLFYRDSDLKTVMDWLYQKYAPRVSQVPAFNSVFVRSKFRNYLSQELKVSPSFVDAETGQKWQSSVYYLLKEVYYNAFLQSREAKDLFKQSVDNEISLIKQAEANPIAYYDKNEQRAVEDFKKRYDELKDNTLSEICQAFMTEYNLQNNENRKVKTAYQSQKNPEIFQHYKMLLMLFLQKAFTRYIAKHKDELGFITSPNTKEGTLKPFEDFLPNWRSNVFDELTKEMEADPSLQRWYILGRLLDGKALNQLTGILRAYVQFTEDIRRRAKETGNDLAFDRSEKLQYYKKVIRVLDFCIRRASVFSAKIEDYFADPDEYSDYLANYLDFKSEKDYYLSPFEELREFCNRDVSKVNIYMDGANPILQRNIVLSKLYGPDQILKHIVNKVTREDLQNYSSLETDILKYKQKGNCETVAEQKKLLEFQRIKNHVEFRDVAEYGELINELLGQLISWSYLRERDLLYFQIGFHYTCLNNTSEKPMLYKKIIRENGTVIDNAILYQIASMYIGGLPMYTCDVKDNGLTAQNGNRSAGAKIMDFCKYSKYALAENHTFSHQGNELALYTAGLELFENVPEHDSITDIRNYIDHFKYYSTREGGKSILDLYSEVFDRFFSYDMKYQKNVTNMLENILLKHFVILKPEFSEGKKEIRNGRNITTKQRAQIDIAKHGLSADMFTFNLTSNNVERSVMLEARDQDYLKTVAKVLYYPHNVKEDLVKPESKHADSGKNAKSVPKSKNRGYDKTVKNDKANQNTGSLRYCPFANIKGN